MMQAFTKNPEMGRDVLFAFATMPDRERCKLNSLCGIEVKKHHPRLRQLISTGQKSGRSVRSSQTLAPIRHGCEGRKIL